MNSNPTLAEREPMYRRVIPPGVDPDVVVDVGSTDATRAFLAGLFPKAEIVALNVNADAVAGHAGPVIVGPAEDLPPDLGADLIFAGEVLEHMVYPDAFLDAAARALRPGGLLVLSTPNLASWHNRLLLLAGYSPTNYSMLPRRHLGVPRAVARRTGLGYGDHVRVFTFRALVELFGTAPWKLVRVDAQNCSAGRRRLAGLRRTLNRLPRGMREDVFVCARLTGTPGVMAERGFVDGGGWVGG